MMRAPFQPLAHLVDAIAEKWCAAEELSGEDRARVHAEITRSFQLGDQLELTFHGIRYLLTLTRAPDSTEPVVSVHRIKTSG